MSYPTLYRKRIIPDECVLLKDDEILSYENNILVTKWKTLKPKKDLDHGFSCYFFDFGYKIPRTSTAQRSCGTAVSYENAQPGDLICYGGHVAIYMGDGQIVHASNSVDGIKVSSNAAYRTILSVRRLV